jgi:hypothetical protein
MIGTSGTAAIDTEQYRIGIYFRDPAVIFCDPGHIPGPARDILRVPLS